MANYNAQDGIFGIGRQAEKGTYVSPQTWLKLLSSGLGSDAELLITDPEIGGSRDIFTDEVDMGPIKYSGGIEFLCRPESLGFLILGALGKCESESFCPGGVYRHVFSPEVDVPYLSLYEREANTYDEYGYTDAVVSKIALNCKAGDWLRGMVDIIATTQTAEVDETPDPFEDTPRFTWNIITVKIDDAEVTPLDMEVSLDNKVEDNYFGLGSLTLIDIPLGRREMAVDMTMRPDDSDMQRIANMGDADNTTPDGTTARFALNIKAESIATIGSTAVPYSLEIDIPVAVLKPFKMDKSGNKNLEAKYMFVPVKDTEDLCTVTLVNGLADYAVES